MNRGFSDSQYSESIKFSNLNQGGLEEAEQNYFRKYATSGLSEVNNVQKITKRTEKISTQENHNTRVIKNAQNEVLRELKQEYEILRNLPIEEKAQPSKIKRNVTSDMSSSSVDDRSDLTSSKRSHHKKDHRSAQILSLEKKQLEIVISNSMKKIEELLLSEMELKKTIHELRLQIQGKGGVNSEYEAAIKAHKKNEKELTEQIDSLKQEIQRKNAALKELGEKVAFLEGERSRRENQSKSFYDQQRQLDYALRAEKDRAMNAELDIKRLKSQFQIMEKNKNSEISSLSRQLEMNSAQPDRDSETIRRLEAELRSRDQKVESLQEQIAGLREQLSSRPSVPQQQPSNENKKMLEELVRSIRIKSEASISHRENSESVMRTLFEKLGNRQDEGLKNELSLLRSQLDMMRKVPQPPTVIVPSNPDPEPQVIQPPVPSMDPELKSRIRELERVIEDERKEKRSLHEEIDVLRVEKSSLDTEIEDYQSRIRHFQDEEGRLHEQIESLEKQYKLRIEESKVENNEIKTQFENLINQDRGGQREPQHNLHHKNLQIEGLQDENRRLSRTIEELKFNLNKEKQERAYSEKILKDAHGNELKRVGDDLQRYRSLLKSKEDEMIRVVQNLRVQIEAKELEIENINRNFETTEKRHKENLQRLRTESDTLLKTTVSSHYTELETMNRNLISVTKMSDGYAAQNQKMAYLEREVMELRRANKGQKKFNEAMDHLWEIKEAEYGNIHRVLSAAKN